MRILAVLPFTSNPNPLADGSICDLIFYLKNLRKRRLELFSVITGKKLRDLWFTFWAKEITRVVMNCVIFMTRVLYKQY